MKIGTKVRITEPNDLVDALVAAGRAITGKITTIGSDDDLGRCLVTLDNGARFWFWLEELEEVTR
jgi:hypothetical protein